MDKFGKKKLSRPFRLCRARLRLEELEPRVLPDGALGGEFALNRTLVGEQAAVQLGSDASGNYVAVWHGPNQNGYGTNDVFAQRFNALGTPLGPETQVNPNWQGEQTYPDVAVAPDGKFVVAYQGEDGNGSGIFVRRYDGGIALSGAVRVNTETVGAQERPAVAIDDAGNFVVTWHSQNQDGSSWGVYAQRYNAEGTALGGEFRVNTTVANEQSTPDVAIKGTGEFVVVWLDSGRDGSGYGVYGQRYDAGGAALGGEFQVNTYTNSYQWFPQVGMAADGKFVVVWQSYQDGSDQGIYGQRFNADGTNVGGEFRVNTYTSSTQANAAVVMAADGSFVVAWESYQQDNSGYGIYVQRYDGGGAVIGGEFRANTYTSNDQTSPAMALGSGDRYLVAWKSWYQDGDQGGIFGQLYGTGLAQPDLVPLDTGAPLGANLSDTINVTATIRNQGNADTGSFAVRYFLSADSVITTEDRPLGGQFAIANLAAMASTTDSRTLQIPAGQATGTFYLGVLVDLNAAVAEADETNNGAGTIGFARLVISESAPQLGAEFRINRTTSGDQAAVQLASDAAGNYVAVWQGPNQQGYGTNTNDVFFQRFNALGTPLGPETQVNPDWRGEQISPDVAVAPDGKFLVAYQADDGNGSGIFLRHYDASGVALAGAVRVNTETIGAQERPAVANDDAGNVVVTWHSQNQDGSSWGVFAQRYNADGTAIGGEFRVNTTVANEQSTPDVAMKGTGEFVVVWHDSGRDGSGYGVYGQRYDAGGAALGGEFQVNTFTSSYQQFPKVAMDSAGNFTVVWQSDQDGSSWGVYGQRYNVDGTVDGSEFRVNTYTSSEQRVPQIAMASDGKFVVAWQSYGQDGSGFGTYAQRYDANGTVIGGEFRSNTYTNSDQASPAIALGSGDRYLLAWKSWYQDGDQGGIFGQLYGSGPSQADLIPLKTSAPAGANQNAIISLTSEVRNQGNAAVGPLSARYYLSTDATITAEDTPLGGPFTIDSLGGMATFVGSHQIQVPADAALGEFYVGLLVDTDNTVTEVDESNNGTASIGFARMVISPPPATLGSEFRMNRTTRGEQTEVEMDSDLAGNYVAVWHGPNQQGFGSNDVFFQRFNALGTPLGPETQVNPDWRGEQDNPDVAVAPDGHFVVVYEASDGSGDGIYARLFDAAGLPLGDPVLVNTYTTNNQQGPTVAVDDNGRFVVAWHSEGQDGSSWGVYAQRFDASGNKLDTEFIVNSHFNNDQSSPDAAMDAAGSFVIVWHSYAQDGSSWGIYGQAYNADGSPSGSEFQVNTYTANYQQNPALAMDAAGSFTVVWQSYQDGSDQGIYGQRFNAGATRLGEEFRVNTYTTSTQANAALAMAADGSFVVAWQSYQDNSGYGIYVQRYDASGIVIGGEFRANTYTSNDQALPAVAMGSGHRFLVAWQSYQDGDQNGIFAQLYGTGLAQPDLVPVAVRSSLGANLETSIQVSSEIRNQGLVDSGSFTAQYYLSTDATITDADVALGEPFQVSNLSAMSTLTDSRRLAVPAVTAGDYYIGLILDTNNVVLEADETNNAYQPHPLEPTVNFQPLPQLGPERRANTAVNDSQSNASVAFDSAGNHVIVWQSRGQDGSGWGIYGQRYDAAGNVAGAEFRINTTTSSDQQEPTVAMAPDGGFVVAWAGNAQDGSGWGVFAQRFDASAHKIGSEFRVNTYTTSDQNAPSVAMDAAGNFMVAWRSQGQDTGNNGGIFAQRYNADGTANGNEFWVASNGAADDYRPALGINASGAFVVAWDNGDTVYARPFQADGTPRRDQFIVNTYTDNQQYAPAIGIDDTGNFVVAWHSWGADGSGWSIRARRFAVNGTALTEEFAVNTHTDNNQTWPGVGMNGAGDFLIAWQSTGQDGSNEGTFAQRYTADGKPYGGEFRVNTFTNDSQHQAAVDLLTLERFVVAWQSEWQDSSQSGIFSQLAGVSDLNSRPNLTVTQNAVPSNVDLGQRVDVTLTVVNTGIAVASPTTLHLWLSDDNVAGNSDDLDLAVDVAVPQLLDVPGSNSFQTTASFFWPANDPFGTDRNYFVVATADAPNALIEANETDNTRVSNQLHLRMTNLVFGQLSVPSQIDPGQQVDATVVVRNVGDATAGPSIGHLWISDDNVAGNADDIDLFIDISVPQLIPYAWPNYEQYQTTISFNWPAVDPYGTDRSYFLVGRLDVTDQVVESNEQDNGSVSNSMHLRMPNLGAEVLSGPTAVHPGEEVSYDIRIRNVGDLAAAESTARLWLSDDDTAGNADDHDLAIDVAVPSIAKNDSYDTTVTFTWPGTDPFGTDLLYRFAVQADYGNAVREADETDNWGLSESIDVLVPDLAISSTRLPSTVSAGQQVVALLRIANLGAESTPGPTTGHVWLSDNNDFGDSDDIDAGADFNIPQIAARQTADVLVTVPLPLTDPFASDGEYHFAFVLDPQNAVPESNETNNSRVSASFAWVVPFDLDINVVGHVGGASYAVATSGSFAYELTSAGLRVEDVSDPLRIVKVGELLFDVQTQSAQDPSLRTAEVIVIDSLVAVADARTVRLIDVSAPSRPTQKWSMSAAPGEHIAGLVVDGSKAYVASGSEMSILDLTDPSAPLEIGQYVLAGPTRGLTVAGDAAYVLYVPPSFAGTGVETVSVASPTQPQFLGRRLLSGDFFHPVVQDNLLALAKYSFVQLFDISNPALPRARGEYSLPGRFLDMSFHGTDLAVLHSQSSDGANGLVVLDVSDPFDPAAIAAEDLGGLSASVGGLWFANNKALASSGNLAVVDLADRFNPVVLGQFSEPYGLQDVTAANSLVAAFDEQKRLNVIDLSQPAVPIPRGLLPINTSGQIKDFVSSGDIAAAVIDSWPADQIHIISLANPDHPTITATYSVSDGDSYSYKVLSVALEGNYLYLLVLESVPGFGLKKRLEVVDISQPSTPSLVGNLVLSQPVDNGSDNVLALSGNQVFVSNAYTRLLGPATSETEPNNTPADSMSLGNGPVFPVISGDISSYDDVDYFRFDGIAGQAVNVSMIGTDIYYKYVELRSSSDAVLASSYFTYTAPAQINGFVLPYSGRYYLACASSYGYTGDYQLEVAFQGNIAIVDVSTPTALAGIGNLQLDQPIRDLLARGSKLYVAVDSPPMLQVWDVSSATSAALLGTAQISEPGKLAFAGNLVHVATSQAIQFVDVADPSRPVTLETFQTDWPLSDLTVSGGLIDIVADSFFALTARPAGVPAPDLAVTTLTVPAAVQVGQNAELGWTVRNHGQQAAEGQWTDTVYLSTDARLDPDTDTLLGELQHIGPLDPLATYDAVLNVSTAGLAAGSYYVIVTTDSADAVNEYFIEANNVRVSPQTMVIGYPDLAVTHLDTPTVVERGNTFELGWIVKNRGNAPAGNPTWTDSVYLSTSGVLDGSETLLGTVEHTTGLGVNRVYNASLEIETTAITDGNYYIIVKTDSGLEVYENGAAANNVQASSQLLIGTPVLTLGESRSDTLDGTGSSRYYRVQVEAGKHLFVSLDDLNDQGHNELYIKFGSAPTRSDYDVRYSANLAADQQIDVADTRGGTYYLLVYGELVPDAPADFTITAAVPEFSIEGLSPTYGGNTGNVTVAIRGFSLPDDAAPVLVAPDRTRITPSSVYRDSTDILYPTFDLTGAAIGAYDVRVQSPGSGTFTEIPDLFIVRQGQGPDVQANLVVPGVERSGREFTIWIEYANRGDTDAPTPLFFVSGSEGTHLSFNERGVTAGALQLLGVSPDGPRGILRPGAAGRIAIHAQAIAAATEFSLATVIADATPMPWDELKETMRPGTIDSAEWDIVWPVLTAQIGDTWADYHSMLVRNATLLPKELGNSADPQDLFSLEVQKAVASVGTSISGIASTADPAIDLGGRSVVARNLNTQETFFTMALNDGSFIFERVTPGPYVFSFDGAVISSGNAATVAEGQVLAGVELHLVRGAKLSGHIRAADTLRPIASARILLTADDGTQLRASTNLAGEYIVEGIPVGAFTATVEAEGRARRAISGLVMGTEVLTQNLDLEVESTISGTVTLEPGGPLDATLTVTAQPVGDAALLGAFVASVEGLGFEIKNLPAGTYNLEIRRDGYQSKTIASITVGTGVAVDPGTINLEVGASISGKVVSRDPNTPASGAVVGVFAGSAQVVSTIVATDGTFLIDALAPGTYTVRVIGLQRDEFGPGVDVTVAKGDALGAIALEILAGGSVEGMVKDPSTSDPIAGVPVVVIGPDGQLLFTVTDATGAYRIDKLGSGDHRVTLLITGPATSQVVTVADIDGGVITADLLFDGVARLSGRLSLADGSAVPNGVAGLYEAGKLIAAATADDEGNYWFELVRAGTFELRASAQGASFDVASGVTVTAGTDLTMNMMAGSASLALSLTDAAGGFEGAQVFLFKTIGSDRTLVSFGGLAPDGSASFANLAVGSYELEVLGNDNRGATGSITIAAGQSASLDVELHQQYRLTGTIADAEGNPVAGATIVLIAGDGSDRQAAGTSDREGRYVVDHLEPGTYVVIVTADEHEAKIQTNVAISADSAVDAVLSPVAAQLTGRLVDSGGRVMSVATISVLDAEGRVLGSATPNINGVFVVEAVVSGNLTLAVAAPGFGHIQINGISATTGATDLGDVTLNAVALAGSRPNTGSGPQAIGLAFGAASILGPQAAASLSVAAFSLPRLVRPLLRSPGEVRPGDVPPPPELRDQCNRPYKPCEGLYTSVLAAIPRQDATFAAAKGLEEVLNNTLYWAGAVWVKNGAIAFGSALAAVVAVQDALVLAGAITVVEPSIGWAITGAITEIVAGYINVKDSLGAVQSAGLQGDAGAALEATGNAATSVVAINLAGRQVVLELLKEKSVFQRVAQQILGLLNAALYFIGTGFQKSIEEMFNAWVEVKSARDEYNRGVENYYGAVSSALSRLGAYRQCLSNPPPPPPPPVMVNKDGTTRIVCSSDPNDKRGPAGFGDAGYIVAGSIMPYTIYYENDPAAGATAPAQVVRIVDELDPDLDWSTFELGPMSLFDDFTVDVPARRSFYETIVDLRPAGNDLLVRVTVGLNSATGELTWLFESLDPETMEAPDDALAGFLPVNDKELHNGEGHVSYTIYPRAGLASGTQITNQANNYFDTNDAVPTPTTLHTIDAGLPSSRVSTLPAQVPDEPFFVSWSGADDANGSGIHSFTVYVSRDHGPWEVWLENFTETTALFTGVGGHHYDFYSIARDNVRHVELGKTAAETGTDVDFSQLRVTRLDVLPSGFVAQFKRPLDGSVLSLYNGQMNLWGEADMTVAGDTVGPVSGSLFYNEATKSVTFIKTGGPLAADTYTVTLRSAADAFKDAEGHFLDGDADDVEGGNYVTRITVEASTAPVLSIADFARGPGQVVDVPATAAGLPIRLSDAAGLLGIDFVLSYDPALLTINNLSLSDALPTDWGIGVNLSVPGRAAVAIYGPTPLPAGPVVLGFFDARIPNNAPYSAAHVLDLHNVIINEGGIPAIDDNGVAVVAYFGDVTGNHRLSALDASFIARVGVGLDTGFDAYRLKDPRLIGDVTGNGQNSALDASWVARKAVGLVQDEIPDLPDVLPPIVSAGPDPLVRIADNFVASPGASISVPIDIDDATGLQAVDFHLVYDTTVFDLSNAEVSLGSLTAGWTLIPNVNDNAGTIDLGIFTTNPLPGGSGSLAVLNFTVRAEAATGPSTLDLLSSTQLNEGQLVATLADGKVTVVTDTTPPEILDIVNVDPDPREAAIAAIDAVFSEPIDLGSFDASDLVLKRNGMNIPLADLVFARLGDSNTYRISGLESFTKKRGNYALSIDPAGIEDLAGNAGSGSPASDTWLTARRLLTFNEDSPNLSGFKVASMLVGVTDADPGAFKGVAVVGLGGNGTWQYSRDNGRKWVKFGTVSANAARLLRDSDKVRFVPKANYNGTATISYHAWDRTTGNAGGTADLTQGTGGATSFSAAMDLAMVVVNAVNDAPVLAAGSGKLTPVLPGTAEPAGDTVASILGATVSDPDAGALRGLAVVGASGTSSQGTWQHSLDDGATWSNLGAVSGTSALLLRDADQLRFVPKPGFLGKVTLTYRAWDRTSATAGTKISISTTGGTSAFSAATQTATLLVNNAPVLNPINPTTSFNEDSPDMAGLKVSAILGNSVSDPDAKALKGIAVVGLTGSGKLQYSLDNGKTWKNLGTPSASAARLLRDTDKIRYIPAANFNGTATITYHAWDRTMGSAGGTANVTLGTGAATSFSADTDEGKVVVHPVNDAPVLTASGNLTPVLPGTAQPPGDTVAGILGSSASDPDVGALRGLALIGATGTSTQGTWQYSLDDGATWNNLGTVSATSALLLGDTDRVRFVPKAGFLGKTTLTYRAWDQTTGTAGTKVVIAKTGGTTAFSAATQTATLLVNTAPKLGSGNPVLVGFGVNGDSLSDEYAEEDYSYARNWVQLLAEARLFPLGSTGDWGEPRRTQYEFNWARSGATSTTLLSNGQDTGLAAQIDAGLVNYAVLAIGQNDFEPDGEAYINLYQGDWSPSQIQDYITLVVSNIATAIDTLAASHVPLVVANIVDYSIAPLTQEFFPDPAGREQVTAAIREVNSQIAAYADSKDLPLADLFGLSKFFFGENAARLGSGVIGGVTITNSAGPSPTNAFVHDGIHTHTVVQAVIANLFLEAFHLGYGAQFPDVQKFTEKEIVELAGLTYGGSTTLNLNYADWVRLPDSSRTVLTFAEDSPNLSGFKVSRMLGSSVSDPDAGALKGVAVMGLSGSGNWQYSLDNGSTWKNFGTASASTARLLRDTDKIRFLPAANFNGTATITYHAWDRTMGSAGGTAKLTLGTGGATSFSANVDVAAVAVTPVNDAPVLTASGALTPVLPGTAEPAGDTVASILGSSVSDADAGALRGLAVIGATGTSGQGTWQYSVNGGASWINLGTVSATSALLLLDTDRLRFVPKAGFLGKATLTYRAWDRTAGTAGTKVSISKTGSTSAFSAATQTASLLVNTAPDLED